VTRPPPAVVNGLLLLDTNHPACLQEFQAQLVQALAQALLPAAIPATTWAVLPGLPRTPAGKLARTTLPGLLPPPAGGVTPPSEAQVMDAFVGGLGYAYSQPQLPHHQQPQPLLEPTSHFFEHLGGTSLAAAAVAAQLGVDPRLVYAYPTARSLAAALRREPPGGGTSALQEQGHPLAGAQRSAATAEQGPGSSSGAAGAQQQEGGRPVAPAISLPFSVHVVPIPAAASIVQPAVSTQLVTDIMWTTLATGVVVKYAIAPCQHCNPTSKHMYHRLVPQKPIHRSHSHQWHQAGTMYMFFSYSAMVRSCNHTCRTHAQIDSCER
jgi:hypothetical protein